MANFAIDMIVFARLIAFFVSQCRYETGLLIKKGCQAAQVE